MRLGLNLCLGAAFLAGYLFWEMVRRRAAKLPARARSRIENDAMLFWRYPEHGTFSPVGLFALANYFVPVEWYTSLGAEGKVFRVLAALAYGFFVVGAACLVGRVLSRLVWGETPELPES